MGFLHLYFANVYFWNMVALLDLIWWDNTVIEFHLMFTVDDAFLPLFLCSYIYTGIGSDSYKQWVVSLVVGTVKCKFLSLGAAVKIL